MIRIAITLSLLLLLAGCATGLPEAGTPGTIAAPFSKPSDKVSFPRGEAFKVYADIRVTYSLHMYKLGAACKGGKVGQEVCAELPRLDEEMRRLDDKIMNALANPATEVDWAAVGEAVKIVMKLAGLFL